jgi:phosphoglycerol transferase MdoB-like AlkP superfamily enzyme
MDIDEALTRVKNRLGIESDNELSPLLRAEPTHFKKQNSKNLVIFIQESMGYQFVATVGGKKDITPNFNRLSAEGIVFKDLYSNGTRSIRGLAGSVAGNFSVPGRGVLKRNKSQTDFFTIATLLKPYGYRSLFLYGGESRFDNMRGWFLGNGFDQIIDQPQFENPSFVGTWGVSDEDLVIKSNETFKNLYEKGEKFAAVMFSTSNHSPFDYPKGKIELVEGVEERSDTNAIKYADYAIGQFIEQARKEAYYKDTVFVIVADHNIRVYGDDMVPVDMFHIPGLILGEGIEAKAYEQLATQPDVLATALDLIGLDLSYPIMGHSIFSDKKQNIALMQFFESYALRVDNKIAVIRPDKAPLTFLYQNKHLVASSSDEELEQDALAFVITLDYLYSEKKYR